MRLKDFLDRFDPEYVIIWDANAYNEEPVFKGFSTYIPYYLLDYKIVKEDKDGNKGLSFRHLNAKENNNHDYGLVIIVK